MVQAAAQAQAVVAAAKNRGGGLVPMNSAQIVALSQIQAQAIVNARPQTALGVGGKSSADEKPSSQQIQNQIQLQAQALVHAHTQAQISAGIYKGGDSTATSGEKPIPAAPLDLPPSQAPVVAHNPISNPMLTTNMHVQSHQQPIQPSTSAASQLNLHQHSGAINAPTPMASSSGLPPAPPRSYAATPMQFASSAIPTSVSAGPIVTSSSNLGNSGSGEDGGVIMPATSPEFLAKLDECLTEFWAGQLEEMRVLGTDRVQTENDFKNHNDLPLARIKRIMKSDEDVRMISAEAPVLFAKACEMFILEMTLRSWNYSENNKRKTLQKEDVKEAIQRTDIFDFLVDVIQ
jgi:histone H3/H4